MALVGVKRGDIWLVDLNPVRGSEQRGILPCLVISNDVVNEHAPTVCVLPLTRNLAGRRFPINVVLAKEDTGLKVDSLLLCGQIRTVAKERLLRKLSSVRAEHISNVEKALKLYLGLS
ncbi:MAG: type II toxin-antitoxin system PemK/MazF family toxin [Anaerolineae bacterium]